MKVRIFPPPLGIYEVIKKQMSREIKFRAWDQKRKEWAMHPNDMESMFGFSSLRKGGFSWMQYTGLKDKNGKEIYEWDIVNRYEKNTYNPEPTVMRVYWNENSCGWSVKDIHLNMHMSDMCILEVIGNVWENPDLLTPNPTKKDETTK